MFSNKTNCFCGGSFSSVGIVQAVSVFHCNTCNSLLTDVVSEESYDEQYKQKYVGRERTDTGVRLNLSRLGILAEFTPVQGVHLDFGGGVGTVCAYARPYFDSYVVDTEYTHKHPLAKVVSPLVTKVDTLTLFDVLEHFASPLELLQQLVKKHTPSTIIISSPYVCPRQNTVSFLNNFIHFKPKEHYWLFSAEGLTRLLNKLGYAVESFRYNEETLRKSQVITVVGGLLQ